jgi:DNA replication factor GINS
MDIDELQTVQSKERQKDSLQHLRDSFYEDVAAYIEELKAERNRVADESDDPFSNSEVSQLSDDIERAEDVVEAIYERRVGKVVKMASFAAADMPVEEEGLTTQERDLFEDMVGRIGDNRSRVLDIVAGEGDSVPASTGGTPGAQPAPTEESPSPEPKSEPESTTVETADSAPAHTEPAVGTGSTDADADASPEAPPEMPPEESSEDETPAAPPEEEIDPRSDGGVAADAPAAGTAAADDVAVDETDSTRTTVRVTQDVGRMLGVDDREYELKTDDVVSLPEDNADALLQREAAERLW